MKCIDVEKLRDEFAGGELDFATRQEIASHLRDFSCCRNETENLQGTSYLLKNIPPIAPSNQLDARMMQAFQKHRETKNKANFWTAFFTTFSISKSALVCSALILIAFTTIAFQLGRSVSHNEMLNTKAIETVAPIVQIVEKRVEIPVIKTIEVPVYRDKVINRIVYRNHTTDKKAGNSEKSDTSIADFYAGNPSLNPNQLTDGNFTTVNLKRFQPVSDIKLSVIKRGTRNEN